ncbi:hypothetical protein [Micromonospora endolithica]|uniref:hypothetical protein n=1 Tax=Micromonospora endolithica TaxID=230091 RepID=UPI0011AC41F5|nr:hypothetical protein [Micromonospora endolithica]TWJ20154.1 hypothetical protein JD76_00249 [Micromonospora endolithica]
MAQPVWADGEAYEAYVGRWSRRVAEEFLGWLDQPPGLHWLDVGCGTGALTATVPARTAPAQVTIRLTARAWAVSGTRPR